MNQTPLVRRSFIFLPGVGAATEKRIWGSGIGDWESFVEAERVAPLNPSRKKDCDDIIIETEERLRERDLTYLSRLFKGTDTWRLYDTFAEDAVFLDIETTGTRRTSPITVVGVYGKNGYDAAIRGKDLDGERISSMLDDTSMVITFNGGSFDLPMIEHQFPGSLPRIPHLDLRWLARRCGLTGGLKSIEMKMGISRPDDVRGMSGEDAVRLWRLFERRFNRNALKLLLKYNREDIVNLKPLTEMLVEESRRRLFE